MVKLLKEFRKTLMDLPMPLNCYNIIIWMKLGQETSDPTVLADYDVLS